MLTKKLNLLLNKTPHFYKLDENNNAIPCSFEEWGVFLEDARGTGRKIVKQENVLDKLVSTVFIGLDHSYEPDELHIFETMVFDKGSECYCDRYATWDEALEGHQKAIKWVKDGCVDEYRE